jgi:hypothetical protein
VPLKGLDCQVSELVTIDQFRLAAVLAAELEELHIELDWEPPASEKLMRPYGILMQRESCMRALRLSCIAAPLCISSLWWVPHTTQCS